jgi:hypothetical protein
MMGVFDLLDYVENNAVNIPCLLAFQVFGTSPDSKAFVFWYNRALVLSIFSNSFRSDRWIFVSERRLCGVFWIFSYLAFMPWRRAVLIGIHKQAETSDPNIGRIARLKTGGSGRREKRLVHSCDRSFGSPSAGLKVLRCAGCHWNEKQNDRDRCFSTRARVIRFLRR